MIVKKTLNKWLFVGLQSALCAALWGQQQTVSSVSIFTDPAGAGLTFYVDGQPFKNAATFLWPAGSKHTVSLLNAAQPGAAPKTQYVFSNWSTNLGPLTDPYSLATITADPALTWIKVTLGAQFELDVNYWVCLPSPQPCASPGTVVVNGTPSIQNSSTFLNAGTLVTVEAQPNPGYIFVGWGQVPGSGNTTTAFVNSYNLSAPLTIYPLFKSAAPLLVTIKTSPLGLKVLLDRTPMTSPATVEWGRGTTHMIGAVTPQTDLLGKYWVFDTWSDSAAVNHPYTVPGSNTATTPITATFAPANKITFLTQPGGLKLTVDGRDNWPSDTFVWRVGSSHTVVALDQVDSNGLGWQFISWSNEGSASQNFTVSGDPTQNRYIATFQAVGGGGPQSVNVPTITSISNGAGSTPEPILAPGSIVSVFGSTLAGGTEVAPGGPLTQTMANVTVRAGDRLLPLFFVSPAQVNLQLPSDLAEGPQTLTVRWEGKPDASAPFTVSRNAPGMFSQLVNGQTFAAALHQDGSAITVDSPARPAEIISLYATGLGPTNHPTLDGFPAGNGVGYMDPISVMVGDHPVNPVSALAAAGSVGLSIVRVAVDANFPAGANAEIKLRVNGHDSNTVLLPIQ